MSKNLDRSISFNSPTNYLLTLILFIFICLIAIYSISPIGPNKSEILAQAFLANKYLNSVITIIFIFGVFYHIRQVYIIYPNLNWIETFRNAYDTEYTKLPPAPLLIRPMANLLLDADKNQDGLNTLTTQTILDSIGMRIDEGRELGRYIGSLLMYLGLVGTFWGLLLMVNSISNEFINFNSNELSNDIPVNDIMKNLSRHLSGMGVAFSSSLFGLSGSLLVGFMDLQSSSAQNKFYTDLEEWLSMMTRTSSDGISKKNEYNKIKKMVAKIIAEEQKDRKN